MSVSDVLQLVLLFSMLIINLIALAAELIKNYQQKR